MIVIVFYHIISLIIFNKFCHLIILFRSIHLIKQINLSNLVYICRICEICDTVYRLFPIVFIPTRDLIRSSLLPKNLRLR
jgi:hypothetical protein